MFEAPTFSVLHPSRFTFYVLRFTFYVLHVDLVLRGLPGQVCLVEVFFQPGVFGAEFDDGFDVSSLGGRGEGVGDRVEAGFQVGDVGLGCVPPLQQLISLPLNRALLALSGLALLTVVTSRGSRVAGLTCWRERLMTRDS